MGDSETAQQGSAGEHAGDVTDNGHAGDVADDEVVGAVPPGAFGPAATSSLQDSLLLMSLTSASARAGMRKTTALQPHVRTSRSALTASVSSTVSSS